MSELKIAIVTQARFSSSRLPGKVLKNLGSETVLGLHLKRIKMAKRPTHFIVATTKEPEAHEIVEIAEQHGFQSFRGDLNDVLDRFYQAVKDIRPDYVVRVTSDCPLIDPVLIDDAIDRCIKEKVDYASNCLNPTLPDGMDVEVFTFNALEEAWRDSKLSSEREHVTPYIRDCGKFSVLSIEYPVDLGGIRMTLDTREDHYVLNSLVRRCGEDAPLHVYVNSLIDNPDLAKINSNFQRNEKYQK